MMRTPGLFLLCAATLTAAEVVGPWNGFMTADGVAPTPVALVLTEQRQQVSGSISFGSDSTQIPIERPGLRGNQFTFQVPLDNHLLAFQLTVNSREMTGEAVVEGRTLKVSLTPARLPTRYDAGIPTAPQLISKTDPDYTPEARAAGIQGTVLVQATITPEGRATDLKVLHSLDVGLDEKALECVATWRFRPATKSGSPVPVPVQIEVNFRLK